MSKTNDNTKSAYSQQTVLSKLNRKESGTARIIECCTKKRYLKLVDININGGKGRRGGAKAKQDCIRCVAVYLEQFCCVQKRGTMRKKETNGWSIIIA